MDEGAGDHWRVHGLTGITTTTKITKRTKEDTTSRRKSVAVVGPRLIAGLWPAIRQPAPQRQPSCAPSYSSCSSCAS